MAGRVGGESRRATPTALRQFYSRQGGDPVSVYPTLRVSVSDQGPAAITRLSTSYLSVGQCLPRFLLAIDGAEQQLLADSVEKVPSRFLLTKELVRR